MNTTLQTLETLEANKLLDALLHDYGTYKQKQKGVRNYLIGLLMLDAGLRVGEVTSLIAMDLTCAGEPAHSLLVKTEKQKRCTQRTIPLTKRLQTAIRVMSEHWWSASRYDDGHPAFYEIDPHYALSVRQVERIIGCAAISSIGRPIHPHVLRHTFATRLMATTSTRIVQVLLGHKSIQSTQIYTHPNNVHLKAAIDGLSCEENGSS